jgi:uncharacterized protein YndB with AHSA1/START domain
VHSTRVSRHIRANPSAIYQALLDPEAIARWRVPNGMTSRVHEFDPREGGRFRVSLTYDEPGRLGKSTSRTDTYRGQFVELVMNEKVVEEMEFETDDPALRGAMTMTTTLISTDDGTDVLVVHQGVPDSVPAADNEAGMRMALDNLANLVESD